MTILLQKETQALVAINHADRALSDYETVLESILDEAYREASNPDAVFSALIETEDKNTEAAIGRAVIRAMATDRYLHKSILGILLQQAFRVARNTAFRDGSLLLYDDWRRMEGEVNRRSAEGRF